MHCLNVQFSSVSAYCTWAQEWIVVCACVWRRLWEQHYCPQYSRSPSVWNCTYRVLAGASCGWAQIELHVHMVLSPPYPAVCCRIKLLNASLAECVHFVGLWSLSGLKIFKTFFVFGKLYVTNKNKCILCFPGWKGQSWLKNKILLLLWLG